MVFSRQNHGNKGVSLQNCRFNQFSKQTFKGIPSPEQIQAAMNTCRPSASSKLSSILVRKPPPHSWPARFVEFDPSPISKWLGHLKTLEFKDTLWCF